MSAWLVVQGRTADGQWSLDQMDAALSQRVRDVQTVIWGPAEISAACKLETHDALVRDGRVTCSFRNGGPLAGRVCGRLVVTVKVWDGPGETKLIEKPFVLDNLCSNTIEPSATGQSTYYLPEAGTLCAQRDYVTRELGCWAKFEGTATT